MSKKFESAKLKRAINTNGTEYTFKRDGMNFFNEPENGKVIATLKGMYHETTDRINIVASDAAQVQTKKKPSILAHFDKAKDIAQGDYVEIKGKRYTVNGVDDFNLWGVIADISLEEPV